MGARFSAPVQTGPGTHSASCTMGARSFPGVKNGRGVTLTPHPIKCHGQERVELYLYSPYGPYGLYRASVPVQRCTLPLPIPLFPLWAVRPVQSLSSCTRVHFTFTYTSTPPMGRTACTEPQCLYKGALYLLFYIENVLNQYICPDRTVMAVPRAPATMWELLHSHRLLLLTFNNLSNQRTTDLTKTNY